MSILEKLAVNLADLRRVGKVTKKRGLLLRAVEVVKVPKSVSKKYLKTVNKYTDAAEDAGRYTLQRRLPKGSTSTATAMYIPTRAQDIKGGLNPSTGPVRGYEGKILHTGDVAHDSFSSGAKLNQQQQTVKEMGARLKPTQREMLNRLVSTHEYNEARQSGLDSPAFFKRFQHANPQVLLNDFNMLATMPKSQKATKDFYMSLGSMQHQLRKFKRYIPKQYADQLGTMRLSRTGRKNMSKIIEKKMAEESRRISEGMKQRGQMDALKPGSIPLHLL